MSFTKVYIRVCKKKSAFFRLWKWRTQKEKDQTREGKFNFWTKLIRVKFFHFYSDIYNSILKIQYHHILNRYFFFYMYQKYFWFYWLCLFRVLVELVLVSDHLFSSSYIEYLYLISFLFSVAYSISQTDLSTIYYLMLTTHQPAGKVIVSFLLLCTVFTLYTLNFFPLSNSLLKKMESKKNLSHFSKTLKWSAHHKINACLKRRMQRSLNTFVLIFLRIC